VPTITYQPTREDLVDAARLHAMGYALGWRRLPLTLVFMLCVVVASDLLLTSSESDAVERGAIAIAAGVSTVVAVLALRSALLPRLVVRRMLRDRRRPLGEWNLLVSESGYKVWGDTASSDMSWVHFVSWREDARVILLYQNQTNYTFVPKRILAHGEAAFITGQLRAAGTPRARLILS
jgi:hypothetical protein